ncbi:MAG: FAD-binding oxidoreductase [Chloroflexota bacterium]
MLTNLIDDNISLWASYTPDYRPLPALNTNITADLAIVGGGFTGISTAYHFKRRYPEKHVVLLEAKTLANGASGRNGGQMLNWIYGAPQDDETLLQIYWVTSAAIDEIEKIIREHNLNVSYRRDGIWHALTSARNAEEAHRDVERLQKMGIPVEFFSQADLARRLHVQGALGASFDPTEGQMNGAQFVRAMRPVLVSLGVEVYEQTPVLSVREGRVIILATPQAEVRADAIVLATNAYTPQLGYFRSTIFPAHSHVFATAPHSPRQFVEMGWLQGAAFDNDHIRLSYTTRTNEGHIIFGGSAAGYAYLFNNQTSFPGSPDSVNANFSEMRRTLADLLPATIESKISHRWTGPVALNLSGVSGMFGVRSEYRNVFYALGYNGHGVTLSNLAGRVLTDMYSGDDHAWRKLPFYQPHTYLVPPEPFRWLGAQAYLKWLAPKRQLHTVTGN